eukprot:TRINITY_DN12722_c0_g3_i1.p1 TRINITY_DN12722_c0_g3~~TRINITY_DN12722_c0_g3_i1.p1  ORF type:complete len:1336 (-),score=235.74 TRINITY_DN12722_c0_g3_i1:606-4613(-)
MSRTISSLRAREVYDSRGNPTVEVDLIMNDMLFRAAVPSGASTGIYEALELRDGDTSRLQGKGVLKAVSNINEMIAPKLKGKDVTKQIELDRYMVEELDGTRNEWGWSKSKLGANAVLAVSMAVCRAGAAASEMTLYEYIATLSGSPATKFVMPVPFFNVINGGSHAGNRLACQEFMILPVGASSFREAMVIGVEVYHTLKGVIKKKYGQDACNLGDEGGFAPSVQDNNEALDLLMEAIRQSGHAAKVKIATDVAASEFYNVKTQRYDLDFKNPAGSLADMRKNTEEMIAYYKAWIERYPLVSIEDPFDQDDWAAYSRFTKEVDASTQVVGDDLLVTNPTRVKKALDVNGCNALLLKVNQIGSVSEALQAASMAQANGWGVMVSHRSGETEDSFIADLAVGIGAGQIKAGAPSRSERLAKYNQLIRIEEELQSDCVFAGANFRRPHVAAGLPVPQVLSLTSKKRVVVVGYGPVGHALVERIVKSGTFDVMVLCEESYAAYNRVKLTTFFEHRSPNKLALSSEDWCKTTGVELIFGRASSIDRAAKTVTYVLNKDGRTATLSYDELVLATGSYAFIPPAPHPLSSQAKGVFVYRTLADSMNIIEFAKVTKRAAVIGGGLLGLEAAKAVYDLKVEGVDIVEMAPWLLSVQIDEEAGALVKEKVEALGVKVHTDTNTLELFKDATGAVSGLKICTRGKELTLDVQMVIVACGVRPRDELAKGCGLELGSRGGVKVNERLCSVTDEHVHAVGEIASLNGGLCYALSSPGYQQAEVLAAHLVRRGDDAKYTGSDLSTKLKLMGVDVGSFGDAASFWFEKKYCCKDESKVMNLTKKDQSKGIYKKLVFSADGKHLLGGILVGDNDAFATLSAIAKKSDLGGLTPQQILDGSVPRVDDGGDGTNLGESDLVCNCHSVPKKVIIAAIEDCADTFEKIKRCTKAGTGCGTCISTGPQPRLLAHTLRRLGRKQGICEAFPFAEADVEALVKARGLRTFDALVSQLAPVGAHCCSLGPCPAARSIILPLLDRLCNGKKRGEGLDHVGQLKALKEALVKFVDEMNCAPILVRLAWHDSGTYDKRITSWPECGGANGSIAYEPEIGHGANNGLSKALAFLEPFKSDYPLVSWGDVIQMASAVSIEHAGGPKISMRYGRQDVAGPRDCPEQKSRGTAANAGLPDAEAPFGCGSDSAAQHLRTIFYRMGFDDQSIVALSGAHTLGRAFNERSGLVQEGYGEARASPYTKSHSGCPVRHDGKEGVGMPGGKSWTKSWLKFDNSYFRDYQERDPNLAWFSTDRALHTDEGFKPHFLKYKEDQSIFFKDYAAAHKMLSELGSKFEPAEGIVID